jgi:hypothetical protein
MSFIKDFFSSPKPPAAPDYTGAAQAQGAANVETARVEGRMNRPDVFSPYDQTLVTDLGNDRFAMNYSLNPEYERQRVKQANIGEQYLDVAGQRLGELPSGQFDFGALPTFQGGVDRTGFTPLASTDDLSDYATRSEGAYYDRAMNRLQPAMDMQRTSLHTDLINSGLPVGSEAYNNSMAQLGLQQNDQMQGLAQSSIAEGQRMRQGLAGEAQFSRYFITKTFTNGRISNINWFTEYWCGWFRYSYNWIKCSGSKCCATTNICSHTSTRS